VRESDRQTAIAMEGEREREKREERREELTISVDVSS
jgi:hypothetical protein